MAEQKTVQKIAPEFVKEVKKIDGKIKDAAKHIQEHFNEKRGIGKLHGALSKARDVNLAIANNPPKDQFEIDGYSDFATKAEEQKASMNLLSRKRQSIQDTIAAERFELKEVRKDLERASKASTLDGAKEALRDANTRLDRILKDKLNPERTLRTSR